MIGTVISYPILQVLFSLGDHRTFAVAVGVGVTASILLSNVFKAGNGPSGAALVTFVKQYIVGTGGQPRVAYSLVENARQVA